MPSQPEIPQRSPDTGGITSVRTLEKMRDTTDTSAGVDEAKLIRQAQEGSQEAFQWLYQTHVRRVYALCLRMVGDPARAEELTQDVFVRIWRGLGSFRHESSFTTWMHRLAVNVVISAQRSEKRRKQQATQGPEGWEEFQAEVREAMPGTRVDLERAIAKLPEGAKQVLILHDVEGYRYREIAEMLEVAEGTVKSQLSRARRLIREALN